MKIFKVLVPFLISIFFTTISYGIVFAKEKAVIVKIDSTVMKEIASWDKKIVFLTSAKTPIHSLSDITKSGGEVGI
jgi:hypothetical protein